MSPKFLVATIISEITSLTYLFKYKRAIEIADINIVRHFSRAL